MKKIFFISILFFFSILGYSQNPHCKNKEKIKAEKVAFLTQELNLNVETAQKFWPIYNELENKMEELRSKRRTLMRKMKPKNIVNLTNEEKIFGADEMINIEFEKGKLKKEYHKKMKKVLSVDQLLRFYHSNHRFKKHLLNKIGKRHRKGWRHENSGGE